MDWRTHTTHLCPECGGTAHLIVTLSEKKPILDHEKRLQYACACETTFAVDGASQVSILRARGQQPR